MPTSKRTQILFTGLAVLCAAAYITPIMRAAEGWGGIEPPFKLISNGSVEGETGDDMSLDQTTCPTLIRTPRGTWLLTYQFDSSDAPVWKNASSALALDKLLPASPARASASDEQAMPFPMPKPSYAATMISRQEEGGGFRPVATVPDFACLHAARDGKTMTLLTGLNVPSSSTGAASGAQSAVFRSNDEGRHWTWMKAGFFPQANSFAHDVAPYFYSDNQVWAWGSMRVTSNPAYSAGGDELQNGLPLFYSPDGGKTVQRVKASAPILMSRDEATKRFPSDATKTDSTGNDGVKAFIVQTDDDHAIAWISQSFYYGIDADPYAKLYAMLMQIELHRQGAQWIMAPGKRTEGANIETLVRTPDGQLYALMRRNRSDDMVARFDSQSGAWKPLADVPNRFAPLPARTAIQGLWADDKFVVITTSAEYRVPRQIYPFGPERATISGFATFYSDDFGQHWKHLALMGSPVALGAPTGELVTAPADGYHATAPLRAYHLGG